VDGSFSQSWGIAEFERSLIRQRCQAGIERANVNQRLAGAARTAAIRIRNKHGCAGLRRLNSALPVLLPGPSTLEIRTGTVFLFAAAENISAISIIPTSAGGIRSIHAIIYAEPFGVSHLVGDDAALTARSNSMNSPAEHQAPR
jgi:hypothetical protein